MKSVQYTMYSYERSVLNRISKILRERFPKRVIAVYAFGSKVRGDHGECSDFDVLIVVKDRDPSIEDGIISIFMDEEIKSGLSFTPLIKDLTAFELERAFKTPFYENIVKEGIVL